MIKPKSNILVFAFFSWYIGRIIKRDFSSFEFNKVHFDSDKAILLLSNHSSWWDGFFIFYLNKLYFKKKFHVLVLEDNARKVWFLKYLGAFSIQKNAKSLIESLEFAGELLDDPNNLLLVFPQGALHSSYVKSVEFEKGITRIIQASKRNFTYVFSAILTDYFNKRKPSLKIFLHNWSGLEYASLQLIKKAYNQHYEESLNQQSTIKV